MSSTYCKKDPKYHQEQLQNGSDTGDVDCGVCAAMHSVSSQSCGWKNPNGASGVDDMRNRMGDTQGGTTVSGWKRGITSYTKKQMGGVVETLQVKVANPGTYDEQKEWLQADKGVLIGADYGLYNQENLPSGDPNFTGYHGIYLKGWKKNDKGESMVLSYDSLFDGRRSGIPSGPTWIRYHLLKPAMEAYAKACGYNGDWYGILAKPGVKNEAEDPCATASAVLSTYQRERRILLDWQGEAFDAGDMELFERIRRLLPRGEDNRETVLTGMRPEPYPEEE